MEGNPEIYLYHYLLLDGVQILGPPTKAKVGAAKANPSLGLGHSVFYLWLGRGLGNGVQILRGSVT